MKPIVHAAIVGIWCLATIGSATAQSVTAEVEDNGTPIRAEYKYTTLMPDAVVYMIILNALTQLDEETGLVMTANGMRIPMEDIAPIYADLVARAAALKEDQESTERDLGCSGNTPRAYGAEAPRLLELMEDSREVVASRHLAQHLERLDSDTKQRLVGWLDEQKKASIQVKYDYVRGYEETGFSNDEVLATICSKGGSQ